MLTSPWVLRLRGITRQLGLNRWIAVALSGGYEDRFGPALRAEVRPRETVWDIGANLGLYTQEFAAAVGPDGKVVAFEPTPDCFASLQERFAGASRVRLMNLAVGASDGALRMSLEENPLAPTHRIVADDDRHGRTVTVPVRSAASIVVEEPGLFPNLIKVDVEGHEGAVLDGMQPLLSDNRLRCVGIEVHFGLLDARDEGHRPKQMEQVLAQHGFQVRWTDPSHLLALR